MSFTPLQSIALRRAEELAYEAEDQLHKLSREHGFINELCTWNTPASDMMVLIRELKDIVGALKAEK